MTPSTATPPASLDDKRREAEAAASDEEAVARTNATPDTDPPLPGEGEGEQPDESVAQLTIEGDEVPLHTVGGRKADLSTLTIKGGQITVAGAMRKGDRVRVVLEGPIAETHFIDVRDPVTGTVSTTKRKHVLKPDFVERVKLDEVTS